MARKKRVLFSKKKISRTCITFWSGFVPSYIFRTKMMNNRDFKQSFRKIYLLDAGYYQNIESQRNLSKYETIRPSKKSNRELSNITYVRYAFYCYENHIRH